MYVIAYRVRSVIVCVVYPINVINNEKQVTKKNVE